MMNECVGTIDEISSSLTTTIATNLTTNTSDTSDKDSTKSHDITLKTLDITCNDKDNKDNIFMKKLNQKSYNRAHYVIIDGKKIRSALSCGRSKKQRKYDDNRRVSFPINDKELVTGYLEPANPWEHAEDVSRDILISSYKESCERHCTEPLKKVLDQLETLDIHNDRCNELCLDHDLLERKHCEPLEEILKRVQFRKIDLEASGLTDESAEIMFDMVEYYESAKHVNISRNGNIGTRGWQACSQMIKKTLCLEQLDAKSIVLTQQHMNILKRPLQLVSHLQILKVENCGLAGRAFVILVTALKLNTGLKELYLADNNLEQQDAWQLGSLLRTNNCLQLLDISNNNIKDEGVHQILDGLISQSNDENGGNQGLKILILWNNHLSRASADYFAKALATSKSLETLNIGQNGLSDDFLDICKEALKHNTVLLQLGVQATGLMNKGIMALAEIVSKNETLQRIDLRDNHIQLTGLTFLSLSMKRNVTITQIDLDEKAWSKAPSLMEQYIVTVAEIRAYCSRNDEPVSTDSSTEESGSPQHRSRLSSVNSRKISLTCQTLPRTSSVQSSVCDLNVRSTTMLEPKRTSGGRLRSPAPSPIPSPVASPIPSPSRSRFVVCRVSEASLSSNNSSASSSPITPPSLSSSPTCFFPATVVGTTTSSSSSASSSSSSTSSSSSRFRVTVVEPKLVSPIKKINNIVTSANTNVTIGFNYRIDTPDRIDSDDSDSVFKSETDEDSRLGSESSADVDVSIDESIITPDSGTIFEIDKIPAIKFSYNETSDVTEAPKSEDNISALDKNDHDDDNMKTNTVMNEETLVEVIDDLSINNVKIDEKIEINTPPKITDVPKQSSLERLLGLFQHPGSLFSGTFTDKNELPLKNTLQGSVNSMMALGDKFHQYLRETTGHTPLQRSVSDADKSSVINKCDTIKYHSIDQLSSIDTNNDLSIDKSLSEVLEVDGEIENFRLNNDNINNAENNENLIDFNIDDNGETCVPVLTYKTEYSIMLSDSENIIDSTMIMDKVNYDTNLCVNKLCDNDTKDSINVCSLSDASVFPIDYNLIDSNICLNNLHDNLNNVDNYESNLPINNLIVNNNQGNDNSDVQYVTIEEEVKKLLASILNVISLMNNDDEIDDKFDNNVASNDFIDFNVNNDEKLNVFDNRENYENTEKDVNLMHDSINNIVNELTITNDDNILLKVSNIVNDRPILADNIINSVKINCQNLTSASSIIDDYDNQQTSRSQNNLFIDKSIKIHRNSQDSGIEEANVSISDDNYDISSQPRDSLQESLDSGIDSECSSVCTRIDLIQSLKDNNQVDKFNDIPVINDNEKKCINSKNLLIKTSVFHNNTDDNHENEDLNNKKDEINHDNIVMIVGNETNQDEHVSTSTSLE